MANSLGHYFLGDLFPSKGLPSAEDDGVAAEFIRAAMADSRIVLEEMAYGIQTEGSLNP